MTQDRHLIDTIKAYFARKSSVQLEEILQANDQERWSPEARVAAGEVLQDRLAGRAQEPLVPEEDLPPPPVPVDPFKLGFLALGALSGLSGFTVLPVYRVNYEGSPEPDLPVPFGPKLAWLALDTPDTEAVAAALGLQETRAATWAEGIEAASQGPVFITPPLGDWVLAVGTSLFPPERAEVFVKPILERLSSQFGDAQYFGTHQNVELHLWARARQGKLVRGYGWLGQQGLTLWNEGAPTRQERALGFSFLDSQSPTGPFPDENCVMQLAGLWSIDPTTLDEEFQEPVMGLLGKFGR